MKTNHLYGAGGTVSETAVEPTVYIPINTADSVRPTERRPLRKHHLAHLSQFELSIIEAKQVQRWTNEDASAILEIEHTGAKHGLLKGWERKNLLEIANKSMTSEGPTLTAMVVFSAAIFLLGMLLMILGRQSYRRRKRMEELRSLAIQLVMKQEQLIQEYLVLDSGSVVVIPKTVVDQPVEIGTHTVGDSIGRTWSDQAERAWYQRHSRHYANMNDIEMSTTFMSSEIGEVSHPGQATQELQDPTPGTENTNVAGTDPNATHPMSPMKQNPFSEPRKALSPCNQLSNRLSSPSVLATIKHQTFSTGLEKIAKLDTENGPPMIGPSSIEEPCDDKTGNNGSKTNAILLSPGRGREAHQRRRRTINLAEHLENQMYHHSNRSDSPASLSTSFDHLPHDVDLATYIENRSMEFCATMWQDAKVRRNQDGNWWLERFGAKPTNNPPGSIIQFGDKFGVDSRILADGENQTWCEWYIEKIIPAQPNDGTQPSKRGHLWGRNSNGEVWEVIYGVDAHGHEWHQRMNANVDSDGFVVVHDQF